ncbi:MAG: response regulator [Polyangiales bacterium]
MKKLNEILLIDDNEADNFYHNRVISRLGCAEHVVVKTDGQQALDYLTTKSGGSFPQPAIVFLDINMPVMNGWEFLEAYKELGPDQGGQLVVIMLTTSLNPNDRKAAEGTTADFQTKPLTRETLMKVLADHFPEVHASVSATPDKTS